MTILVIVYFLELAFFSYAIFQASRSYFTAVTIKAEDFYLLNSSLFIFLHYATQLYALTQPVYATSVVVFSHSMKIFSFWGLLYFALSSLYIKSSTYYRALKFLISFVFFTGLAYSLSLITQKNFIYYISNTQSMAHAVSLLPNIVSSIIFESMCFFSTVWLLINHKKLAMGGSKYIFPGLIFLILKYILSLTNSIFFEGLSYILFLIAYHFGTFSVVIMCYEIVLYFTKKKKEPKKLPQINILSLLDDDDDI